MLLTHKSQFKTVANPFRRDSKPRSGRKRLTVMICFATLSLLPCTLSFGGQGGREADVKGKADAQSKPESKQDSDSKPLAAVARTEGGTIGAALYARNCAICHEAGTIPYSNRHVMKGMSADYIVRMLSVGTMREQGAKLNAGEREAIAEYLTGKSVVKAGSIGTGPGQCSAKPAMNSSGAAWSGWGVDLENSRFQPASEAGLTAEQVPHLKLKWAFGYPGEFAAYSQPSVAGGRVYVGSPLGQVYSLDTKTGCTYWAFQALGGVRGAVTVGPLGMAYFGDTRAYVYAVDTSSGRLIWKTKVDEHPLARVTSSVKFYQDRLYLGVSSREEWLSSSSQYKCCTFRGKVLALDAKTGKRIWETHTILNEPKPTQKNSEGTQLYGPSGAAVWASPTIDEAQQTLYVGTGDNYSEPATENSDSVVAFDLTTGTIKWSKQLTSGDVFNGGCLQPGHASCPDQAGPDFDFGASPILRKLADGRRILILGQKSGVLHALDPDKKGEILWQTRIGKGSVLGGIQWGAAADFSYVFAAISDIGLMQGPEGFTPDPKLGGGMHAVDLTSGRKVWDVLPSADGCKTPRCSPAKSAAVSAIPGAVFSGSEDGHIRAYSATSGDILWDYDTLPGVETVNKIAAKGGTIDGGGPAIAGGMVFVNSGYGFLYGAPGNVLLAFGVE